MAVLYICRSSPTCPVDCPPRRSLSVLLWPSNPLAMRTIPVGASPCAAHGDRATGRSASANASTAQSCTYRRSCGRGGGTSRWRDWKVASNARAAARIACGWHSVSRPIRNRRVREVAEIKRAAFAPPVSKLTRPTASTLQPVCCRDASSRSALHGRIAGSP